MVRWYANQGKSHAIYYYRDHYGHEVDFVIPVGEKLKLFECKWSETPSYRVKGFEEITKLIGENNVLSKSLITPVRGTRHIRTQQISVEDGIEFRNLG